MVFRGHGKGGGSDETRVPTSKFITKSRSGPAPKQSSFNALNSTAGTAMHSSVSTIPHPHVETNSNTLKLPEDVQVNVKVRLANLLNPINLFKVSAVN